MVENVNSELFFDLKLDENYEPQENRHSLNVNYDTLKIKKDPSNPKSNGSRRPSVIDR